jgi:hypothetical protein
MTAEPIMRVVEYSGTSRAPMTRQEAEEFLAYLRTTQAQFVTRVLDAYNRVAHLALGYESWSAMCEAEGFASLARLPRDKRAGVVVQLHSAGMSQRAIAGAIGVSQDTVRQDLDHSGERNRSGERSSTVGLDGKAYERRPFTAGGIVIRNDQGERLRSAHRKIGQAALLLEGFPELRDAARELARRVKGVMA